MAREEKVVFKVTPEIKKDIQEFSERFGITQSAFCAYVIGQYIDQQKRVVNPMLEQMGAVLQETLKGVITDEGQNRP